MCCGGTALDKLVGVRPRGDTTSPFKQRAISWHASAKVASGSTGPRRAGSANLAIDASSGGDVTNSKKGLALHRGLALPPRPPHVPFPTDSKLLVASRAMAKRKAQSFTQGEDAMAFKMPLEKLQRLTEAVDEASLYGVNANTASIDARAWDMYETVCEAHGTSPMRTAQDVKDYPERNAHLLAMLLLHAFVTCVPKKGKDFIKPRSALAYVLAIIRIFARWGIVMPSYRMIQQSVNYLSRLYISYYGPHSLAARRAEPMKYSMVLAIDTIEEGTMVGNILWKYDDHDIMMFRALNCTLFPTGFRLAAAVGNGSAEIFYFCFSSLAWILGGVFFEAPTKQQLLEAKKGRVKAQAVLSPPREKPDQWGELHFNFPSYLTYRDEPGNAAKHLLEIELRTECSVGQRESMPLFHNLNGKPYTHAFMDRMLKTVLTFLFSAAVATVFRWHSYRSGLATHLFAGDVPDATIQLLCRWACPSSLQAYRRLSAEKHEALVKRAMKAKVSAVQSKNIPVISADQGFARLFDSMAGKQDAKSEREFASARKQPEELRLPQTSQRESGMVLVPRSLWPRYACFENEGRGWTGRIVSRTKSSAMVQFAYHKTKDGRPYAPVRVPLNSLSAI